MAVSGYILIFGSLAAFAAIVIWAMWWAIRGGQMSDFQRGATSIFDDDEPMGTATDAFPGERPKNPQDEKPR
jgi:cbb3-type cytochrome oxidase maturation protein